MTQDDRFYRCPGAWYGTLPGQASRYGHICIDPAKLLAAIAFLRRWYHITATSVEQVVAQGHAGILFQLEAK